MFAWYGRVREFARIFLAWYRVGLRATTDVSGSQSRHPHARQRLSAAMPGPGRLRPHHTAAPPARQVAGLRRAFAWYGGLHGANQRIRKQPANTGVQPPCSSGHTAHAHRQARRGRCGTPRVGTTPTRSRSPYVWHGNGSGARNGAPCQPVNRRRISIPCDIEDDTVFHWTGFSNFAL